MASVAHAVVSGTAFSYIIEHRYHAQASGRAEQVRIERLKDARRGSGRLCNER